MAPRKTPAGPPHAGHQLHQLAAAATTAHDAIGEAEAAAVYDAVAALESGRLSKAARRADRLKAIEERNKHAAGAAERHPGG